MIKILTLTKQSVHRIVWASAVAMAAVAPSWAQTAMQPSQAEAQTKLDSVATYLAKTIGYPKASATARVELQSLYDTHHSSAATMTADTYAALTAKLAAFRAARTDIQFPTPDAYYYLKAKGSANVATSSNSMGTYSHAEVHVFHTTAGGKFQWEPTRNTATPMKYIFQAKGTSVAHSFALRHFETNTYISNNVDKTSTAFNLFLEPRGDGRFVIKRTETNRPIIAWKNGRLDGWTPILEHDYFYFEFEKADLGAVLTITSNISAAGGKFSWNGHTLVGGGTIVLDNGHTITDSVLKYSPTIAEGLYTFTGFTDDQGNAITSVASLSGSKTIKANFAPAFFSAAYGEKWVRIATASNPNVVWGLANTTNYDGSQVTTASLDFAAPQTLWCFVGTADSFKIYNKHVGETLAVTSATPADGTNALFAPAASAATWALRAAHAGGAATAPGFTLDLKSSNGTYSLNSYGGASPGNRIAYYLASDGGSHWTIKDASVTATIESTLANLPAELPNTQHAYCELPFTFDGITSRLPLKAQATESKTLYLPKWLEAQVALPTAQRAYAVEQVSVNDEAITTTKTLGAGLSALVIKVKGSYTDPTAHTLFASPDSVHGKPFRIPAIGRAFNGDLIALSDYRPDRGDVGYGGNRIDLVAKISKDNGRTWTNTIVVAQHSETDRKKRAYGDAAIATDRESNRVLVLGVTGEFQFQSSTLENRLRLVSIYGNYNQDTNLWEWSEPNDITDYIYTDVLKNQEKSIFTAAGKLMQSRSVKVGNYYRIYNVLTTRPNDNSPNRNRVLYSDDFGATWHHLGNVDIDRTYLIHGDEAKCEELPDGTIIITSRAGNLRRANVFTYGSNADDVANGRGTWGTQTTYLDGHGNNATNGETYFIHATKKATNTPVYLAMQTVPADNGRAKVTFFYKEIDLAAFRMGNLGNASTWQHTLLTPNSSAYSTFALQADGKLGFFIEELPQGKNGGGGYDMNYFARTLEQLTSDQYTLDQTLTLDASGYAAFVAPYPVALPTGLEVFTAHVETGSTELTLTPYGSQVVAANTPVILKGTAGMSYTYQETHISKTAAASNSQLYSVAQAANLSPKAQGALYYTLGYDSESTLAESAGFYVTEAEAQNGQNFLRLQPSTIYLKLPAANAIRGYRFNKSPITSIATATAANASAAIYDLQGRRQTATITPGIYIIGGKKVIIKR